MHNTSGRLYKIINFHHAIQIFESGNLYFSHPSKWEDPYETRLIHKDLQRVYAQCWCSKGVSDAMWRIYSPHHLGIRIGTSTRKLRKALNAASKSSNVKFRMEDVQYMSQFEINQKSKNLKSELALNFDITQATDLLFMKRDAYEHECEYRVVAITESKKAEDGIKIKIEPFSVIDSILIDPRAPNELAEALVYYFKNKIGFKKKCVKSSLYKTPNSLVIE